MYFDNFRALVPSLQVLEVSTDFQFVGTRPVRENFRKQLSYSAFRFENKPASDLHEFSNVRQEGCSTVTLVKADRSEEVYQVKSSSETSLVAASADGNQISYTWLSPRQVRISKIYEAFDLPCGNDKKPHLVEYTRVLDWTQQPLAPLDAGSSPLAPKREYLALVADAVGRSVSDFYTTAPALDGTSQGVIDAAKLTELTELPPRPEIITCTGLPGPSPSPIPPEEGSPSSPGEEEGPRDGDSGTPEAPEAPDSPDDAGETSPPTPLV
jgi:hypothetical protein